MSYSNLSSERAGQNFIVRVPLRGGFEPPSEWLTATRSTLKLAEHLGGGFSVVSITFIATGAFTPQITRRAKCA